MLKRKDLREYSMDCLKCFTENSDGRRFCRECGSLIVSCCQRCGFNNSLTDKYCGGCGISLSDAESATEKDVFPSQTYAMSSGKYSAEDISELMKEQSQPAEKKEKKIISKKAETVSQDMLDSIFDATDSD